MQEDGRVVIEADGIRSRVREAVASLARLPERAGEPEARLVEDLEYDSLRLIELSIVLEQAFGLKSMSRAQVADITTVGQVETLVLRLLDERGRSAAGAA